MLDGAEVLHEHSVQTNHDERHEAQDIDVGGRSKQRARFFEATQVGDGHDDDEANAEFDSVLHKAWEGRHDGRYTASNRYCNRQDVVGE